MPAPFRKFLPLLFRAAPLILFLAGSFNSRTSAQELWGHANSNYSGVMGLHLNPAGIVGVPYNYEVNVIAGDVFYDNNYLYLPKISDVKINTADAENGTQDNSNVLLEYNNKKTKHAYASGLLLGPSYIRNKNTKAWAVHTFMRAVISANEIPYPIARGFYTKFDDDQLHNSAFNNMNATAAGMLLGGIGFTYAKVLSDRDPHWLAMGATLNGIVGFDGMFFHADVKEYVIPDSNSLYMNNVNLDYGHAIPGQSGGLLSIRGYGGSAGLGAVYIHRRNPGAYECGKNADRRKRYDYKIGVSLIDLGYVYYNKGASRFQVNDGTFQWDHIDTAEFKNIADVDAQLSIHSGSSLSSDHFGIFMPAAASLQFDYCVKPRWYANLSVVQRLPVSEKQVLRSNSIALVPRYETRKFEASISANVYEYEKVYMGAAIRYLFFVVGTDRLLSFMGSDVRSLDVFFGFKFNSCMLRKKNSNKGGCPMNG